MNFSSLQSFLIHNHKGLPISMLSRSIQSLIVLVPAAALAHAQKPALIQNVDEKGRVPFQQTLTGYTDSACKSCDLSIPVPAGQRLVVTHVSGSIEVLQFGTPASLAGVATLSSGPLQPVPVNGADNLHLVYLPMTYVGESDSGRPHAPLYIFDSNVTSYVDGVTGCSALVSVSLSSSLNLATMGGSNMKASVSGYLIPLPAGSTSAASCDSTTRTKTGS